MNYGYQQGYGYNLYNPNPNQYNSYPSYGGYGVQQPQQPNQQTSFLLTFVKGLNGAKEYLVGPNQTVYLKDMDSNLLFVKKANNEGMYSINVLELKETNVDSSGNVQTAAKVEYATKDDINNLMALFNENMNKLSTDIQSVLNSAKKGE